MRTVVIPVVLPVALNGLAGEYTSSAAFFKGAVIPLNACFNEPIKFEVGEYFCSVLRRVRSSLLNITSHHIGRRNRTVDAFVQPTEFNDDAEKNITKAVLEMTGTATIKKTGKVWVNHYWYVYSAQACVLWSDDRDGNLE